jgi:hypothetical protein
MDKKKQATKKKKGFSFTKNEDNAIFLDQLFNLADIAGKAIEKNFSNIYTESQQQEINGIGCKAVGNILTIYADSCVSFSMDQPKLQLLRRRSIMIFTYLHSEQFLKGGLTFQEQKEFFFKISQMNLEKMVRIYPQCMEDEKSNWKDDDDVVNKNKMIKKKSPREKIPQETEPHKYNQTSPSSLSMTTSPSLTDCIGSFFDTMCQRILESKDLDEKQKAEKIAEFRDSRLFFIEVD